jgi:hypothetical protein
MKNSDCQNKISDVLVCDPARAAIYSLKKSHEDISIAPLHLMLFQVILWKDAPIFFLLFF